MRRNSAFFLTTIAIQKEIKITAKNHSKGIGVLILSTAKSKLLQMILSAWINIQPNLFS